MKRLSRNSPGFTLIELMIVVAIIGILAAIAIPQFSSYRMRSFNAAAVSDLRNCATNQGGLFTDVQSFGVTMPAATRQIPMSFDGSDGGTGEVAIGPAPTGRVYSLQITPKDMEGNDLTPSGILLDLSNGVHLFANTDELDGDTPRATNYILGCKHFSGNLMLGRDSDSDVMYQVQSDEIVDKKLTVFSGDYPATNGTDGSLDKFAGASISTGVQTRVWQTK